MWLSRWLLIECSYLSNEHIVTNLWTWTEDSFVRFQIIIFQDIKKSFHWVTKMGLEPHQNFFQFFQQVWLLQDLKVFEEWKAHWPTDFLSIQPRLMIKCWKFQVDILIYIRFIVHQLKKFGYCRPTPVGNRTIPTE